MKKQNYFNHSPIQDWTISKDVEHIFLGTIEKQERWQRIKENNKPTQLTAVPNLKPFNLNLN